jgi:deoxyribonuclease V
MLVAFDVHYHDDRRASSAAVLFRAYTDAGAESEYVVTTQVASRYVPGQFYKRELPCILALLHRLHETPDAMIVDGYVMLGDRPGLGYHLFEVFHGSIPVIGVAKSPYRHAGAIEVVRGRSRQPLYVTAGGIDSREAAERIRGMHGPYRIPTLLKRADFLARKGVSLNP